MIIRTSHTLCNNEKGWLCCGSVLSFLRKKGFFLRVDLDCCDCKLICSSGEVYVFCCCFLVCFWALAIDYRGIMQVLFPPELIWEIVWSIWMYVISAVFDLTDIALNVVLFKFLRDGKYSWGLPLNLARVLDRSY